MIRFEVGKMYDCGSFHGNENVFRIASRTEHTVELVAVYELIRYEGEGEEEKEVSEIKESNMGHWDIEVIDDVECVLIEQGYFDDEDKEYIMANYPYESGSVPEG